MNRRSAFSRHLNWVPLVEHVAELARVQMRHVVCCHRLNSGESSYYSSGLITNPLSSFGKKYVLLAGIRS